MFTNFLKKYTDYTPKSFKGKTAKDILAMKSSNVPVKFFDEDYTSAHLQEFIDADLSADQENAIDLLSDLKNKEIILKKCYTRRPKRALKALKDEDKEEGPAQQGPAQQGPAQEQEQEPAEAAEQADAADAAQQKGGRRRRGKKGTLRKKRTNKKKTKRVHFAV
jgi:hypothetical protein